MLRWPQLQTEITGNFRVTDIRPQQGKYFLSDLKILILENQVLHSFATSLKKERMTQGCIPVL